MEYDSVLVVRRSTLDVQTLDAGGTLSARLARCSGGPHEGCSGVCGHDKASHS